MYKGAALTIGGADTDSVTINGSGNDLGGFGIITQTSGNTTVQAKHISINTTSASAYRGAVWAQNNTQYETAPTNAASITLTGDTIDISAPTMGIVNYTNGQVNINGDLTLTAPIAISARAHSTTNINTDDKHSTVINGDIEFETPAVEGTGQ